jgi:hypothetical protein
MAHKRKLEGAVVASDIVHEHVSFHLHRCVVSNLYVSLIEHAEHAALPLHSVLWFNSPSVFCVVSLISLDRLLSPPTNNLDDGA